MTTWVWAVIVLLATQTSSLVAEFQGGDRYAKIRIVSEAVLGKRPASEDDVRVLLLTAMKDPDVSVRANAVGSVSSIRMVSVMPKVPPGQEWAVRLRNVGEALLPAIETALDDTESRVRMEALRGIVGPPALANPGAALPLPYVKKAAEAYDRDRSTSVRTLALQSALSAYRGADREAQQIAAGLLLRALAESDEYLIQAAGLAATTAKVPEALPLLVKQLKHPSHIARMGVAQGIASYRELARPYLAELNAALAVETHDITRKTIAGTISVIMK